MDEFDGETAYDSSTFVTPAGHPGVTFLTASNDNGAFTYGAFGPSTPDNSYFPATSPNVVSVGGTQITLSNDGYGSETSWSFPTPASTFDFASGSQTGTWQSKSGGFDGNYGVASDAGTSTVTWTVPVTPATYGFGTELSATWTANAGNATDAVYDVYDGTPSSGTLLASIPVDQTQAPLGTADGGKQFQELGVFFPTVNSATDGTLTVVLTTSGADGNVDADTLGASQGWASTGGPSDLEPEPAYQDNFQSTGDRTTPDVSLVSSQFSGVTTYITPFRNPGDAGLNFGGFGTSLACPCWAGIIAIINQGRVAAGGSSLNSPSNPQQTLQGLYSLSDSDYHDITTGYNGYFAAAGYDNVTGRGTPIANLLVPAMVAFDLPSNVVATQLAFDGQPLGGQAGQTLTHTGADTPSLVVNLVDANGHIATNDNSDVTITLTATNGATLGGMTVVQAVSGVATFSNLVIDTAGAGYKLSVTDGVLTSANSSAFTITPELSSSRLAITTQPNATTIDAPLSPTLVVKSVDEFGNVISTIHSKITLSSTSGSFTGTRTVALTNGVATFSKITFKTAGTFLLTATPASNSGLANPAAVSFNETINPASTIIPNPTLKVGGYVFGSTITLADTLTSDVPTSAIPFNSTQSKPTLIISGTDNILATSFTGAGLAKFTVPVLDVGTYDLQITYPGDTNHPGNVGSDFNLVINAASTTTTLVSSATSRVVGQQLTLTTHVKASSGALPTGRIEFLDNGQPLGTVTLSNATAAFTLTTPEAGPQQYQATYLPSPNFITSTSAIKKLTISKDKTSVHFTAPTAGTSIPRIQTFNLTVQAEVIAPGVASFGGSLVTVKDNGKPIGTITLNSAGAGTLTSQSFTSSGAHSLTAILATSTDLLAATSPALKLISS